MPGVKRTLLHFLRVALCALGFQSAVALLVLIDPAAHIWSWGAYVWLLLAVVGLFKLVGKLRVSEARDEIVVAVGAVLTAIAIIAVFVPGFPPVLEAGSFVAVGESRTGYAEDRTGGQYVTKYWPHEVHRADCRKLKTRDSMGVGEPAQKRYYTWQAGLFSGHLPCEICISEGFGQFALAGSTLAETSLFGFGIAAGVIVDNAWFLLNRLALPFLAVYGIYRLAKLRQARREQCKHSGQSDQSGTSK